MSSWPGPHCSVLFCLKRNWRKGKKAHGSHPIDFISSREHFLSLFGKREGNERFIGNGIGPRRSGRGLRARFIIGIGIALTNHRSLINPWRCWFGLSAKVSFILFYCRYYWMEEKVSWTNRKCERRKEEIGIGISKERKGDVIRFRTWWREGRTCARILSKGKGFQDDKQAGRLSGWILSDLLSWLGLACHVRLVGRPGQKATAFYIYLF